MNKVQFVPSSLHIVASGIDVSQDLQNNNEHSISALLKDQDDKEKTSQKNNN
jgi:hypothetical protein